MLSAMGCGWSASHAARRADALDSTRHLPSEVSAKGGTAFEPRGDAPESAFAVAEPDNGV